MGNHKNSAARRGRSHAVLPVLLFVLGFCFLSVPSVPASETGAVWGRASWYGNSAHGKKTANGETFNRHALTAAHNRLPFGTIVRVHNLNNGRQVLVRVNDRGPFVQGRILDVSRKAAEILGMTTSGVVPVRLEIVSGKKGAPLAAGNAFYVHIADARGVFEARDNAAKLKKRLKMPVRVLWRPDSPVKGFALCLGPFQGFKEAHKQFMKLVEKNSEAIGVIEASARGNIPFHRSQRGSQAGLRPADLSEELAVLWKAVTASCHPTFYVLSLLAMENKGFFLAEPASRSTFS